MEEGGGVRRRLEPATDVAEDRWTGRAGEGIRPICLRPSERKSEEESGCCCAMGPGGGAALQGGGRGLQVRRYGPYASAGAEREGVEGMEGEGRALPPAKMGSRRLRAPRGGRVFVGTRGGPPQSRGCRRSCRSLCLHCQNVACHIFGVSATSFKISWLRRDRSALPRGAPSRPAGGIPKKSADPIVSTSATTPWPAGIPGGGQSRCPSRHGEGRAATPTLRTAATRRQLPRGGRRAASAAARGRQCRPPRVGRQRWRRRRRARTIPPVAARVEAGRPLAAGAPARGRMGKKERAVPT